jgi:hypothetical protein
MAIRASILYVLGLSTLACAMRVPGARVGGNYQLLVCREGCGGGDTSRAYIVGTLVLGDTSIHSRRGISLADGSSNGCFQLERIKEMKDSYAGIMRGARVRWKRVAQSDSITFPLYRSPDAGYEVQLVRSGDTFKGTGRSWGAGAAYIEAPRDSIIAMRIGDVDSQVCLNRR